MSNILYLDKKLTKNACLHERVLSPSASAFSSGSSILKKKTGAACLPHIPHDVKVEIALKLSNSSLTTIGNILLSGKEGRHTILNSEFRKRVDLSPFIQNSQLVSRSLNFFHDCVEDDNPQALYLHGLESLCVYGELHNGGFYIERAANLGDDRAIVMNALILVCSGLPEFGKDLLDNAIDGWENKINVVNSHAKENEMTLLQFCHTGHGVFEETWDCPFPEYNPLSLAAFDYRIEEVPGNGSDWTIVVETVIIQDQNRDTIHFSYSFSLEEFIADEPSPLKDELFCAFISGGVSTTTSLNYIFSATMAARDITSSPDIGPGNLLRFTFCLQSRPRSSIIEEYLDTGSGSEEENLQLNIAIQQSLQNVEVKFIPTDETTVDSLSVHIYSGCHCGTICCECTQCVICLENFVTGAEIVKLDCGHKFDHGCIVKWLNTSHYCPICKHELPIRKN